MPETPNYSLPYPTLADPPNGPQQLEDLATATDNAIHQMYLSTRPIGGTRTLGNITTAPTVGEWYTWDGSLILANPGSSCLVLGWASGFMLNDAAGTLGRLRVGISLDGGSTWSNGAQVTDQAGSANGSTAATRRGGFTAFHMAQGTPSSNILIRAQVQWSDGGLGADPDFYDGSVMALVLPFG